MASFSVWMRGQMNFIVGKFLASFKPQAKNMLIA